MTWIWLGILWQEFLIDCIVGDFDGQKAAKYWIYCQKKSIKKSAFWACAHLALFLSEKNDPHLALSEERAPLRYISRWHHINKEFCSIWPLICVSICQKIITFYKVKARFFNGIYHHQRTHIKFIFHIPQTIYWIEKIPKLRHHIW